MDIIKGTLRESPYVGVFGFATEDVILVPKSAGRKETAGLEEKFGAEVIGTAVANSSLVGVFVAGLGKRFVLPDIATEGEVKELESAGVKVMQIEELTALGNLISVNGKGGVASRLLGKENVKGLKKFFGVEFVQSNVAGTNLPGACIVATEKGFIANPNVSAEEFKQLGKVFGVPGSTTTANYGDPFVGNDVVANSRAALVGVQTSGHELIRIDEGFRGE